MHSHGHEKAEFRNLELHKAALGKLERHPELLMSVLALLERWLEDDAQSSARAHLRKWREMLTELPFQEMAERVLHPQEGQTLRQCSPLGPVLDPRERWAIFLEADRKADQFEAEANS